MIKNPSSGALPVRLFWLRLSSSRCSRRAFLFSLFFPRRFTHLRGRCSLAGGTSARTRRRSRARCGSSSPTASRPTSRSRSAAPTAPRSARPSGERALYGWRRPFVRSLPSLPSLAELTQLIERLPFGSRSGSSMTPSTERWSSTRPPPRRGTPAVPDGRTPPSTPTDARKVSVSLFTLAWSDCERNGRREAREMKSSRRVLNDRMPSDKSMRVHLCGNRLNLRAAPSSRTLTWKRAPRLCAFIEKKLAKSCAQRGKNHPAYQPGANKSASLVSFIILETPFTELTIVIAGAAFISKCLSLFPYSK